MPPGSTIGILGGGQLGRMLALAAARLGLKVVVFDPDPNAPAAQVCAGHECAGYDDIAALERFAGVVDVVTYEFENIPTDALDAVEAHVPIRPDRRALATSQDRLSEKTFLEGIGLRVAPFAPVETAAELAGAVARIGTPSILKTRRFGYDGKGQVRLRSPGDAAAAWAELNEEPCVLEGFVRFEREISVIGARGVSGQIACFDPGENVHRDGILHTTTVPASIPHGLATDAVLLAGRILNALDYVGVIGVELFVTAEGLLVNEFAPRVHNSGHWTQDACAIDQFEQHVRAVAGWPLGDGQRHSDAVMTNLIGADAHDWLEAGRAGGLHLYGKAEARPGRKMGHVNRISPRR
nr:5-(carboxyamino)imidazole ribonucleotide synthase [Halovulum dunhuangense]